MSEFLNFKIEQYKKSRDYRKSKKRLIFQKLET